MGLPMLTDPSPLRYKIGSNEGVSADFFPSRWLYLSQFLMVGNSNFFKSNLTYQIKNVF